jgi:hypothetical protein
MNLKRAGSILVDSLCMLTLVATVGCSSSSQEAQVSGRVTLDGSRIGVGTIVFAPVEGGKPATGSIESDGSFVVNTSREPGLAAGKYKVAVSIREMPKNVKRSDQPPPGRLLIPERYEQADASGLQFEIRPGKNSIDIELTST